VVPLVALDKQRVVAYLRQEGKQGIVVVLNDSTASQTVTIPTPQLANGSHLTDLLSGGRELTVRKGALRVTVPKLSGRVLG
jgi:hypothetical protein